MRSAAPSSHASDSGTSITCWFELPRQCNWVSRRSFLYGPSTRTSIQRATSRVFTYSPVVAGIHRIVFPGKRLRTSLCKRKDLCLVRCMQRIAAAESDAGNVRLCKLSKTPLFPSHRTKVLPSDPMSRILALRTMMAAAGHPEYDAQSIAIQHVIFCYVMISHRCSPP